MESSRIFHEANEFAYEGRKQMESTGRVAKKEAYETVDEAVREATELHKREALRFHPQGRLPSLIIHGPRLPTSKTRTECRIM
jgi:hypothetical protein